MMTDGETSDQSLTAEEMFFDDPSVGETVG